MCGRYELHAQPAAIALAFGLPFPPDLTPRYNIAPTQRVPIVRLDGEGNRQLEQVRWGLVPFWAKDPSIGSKMINARGETVKDKPAFRTAYKRHRCLLPASGFYEWQALPGANKQPMHIGMKDGAVFALAGLTERWKQPDGEWLVTCTIVTIPANELLQPIHDRMPVIVPITDYARWLDFAVEDPADLIAPFPSANMSYAPISTKVNAVKNEGPALIERNSA